MRSLLFVFFTVFSLSAHAAPERAKLILVSHSDPQSVFTSAIQVRSQWVDGQKHALQYVEQTFPVSMLPISELPSAAQYFGGDIRSVQVVDLGSEATVLDYPGMDEPYRMDDDCEYLGFQPHCAATFIDTQNEDGVSVVYSTLLIQ